MNKQINGTKHEAYSSWVNWKRHNSELYHQITKQCAMCGHIGIRSLKELQICHTKIHSLENITYKVIVDD